MRPHAKETSMARLARPVRFLRQRTSRPRRWHARLCVKELEARTMLSASPLDNVVAQPLVSTTVQPLGLYGYTPPQISQAYGFNRINFNGVPGDGTGVTIAIVDAFHD